jgi:hypothetical protein
VTAAGAILRRLAAGAACGVCAVAIAASPTPSEVAKLCANAEDQAHCGRLVEATQLKRLARIAERNGDELRISLAPTGLTVFRDAINIIGARTYAVWDYIADLDTIVLFATNGDRTEFWLVQRRGGAETRMPSEPVISPDRKRIATADFCADLCDNELAVWRIGPDGARKESAWTPDDRWSEASVAWKDADTLAIDYEPANGSARRTLERRLNDPSWRRTP